MMNGGMPSGSDMANVIGPQDQTTSGFLKLGDQGDAMTMARSGAVMPGANPTPGGAGSAPTITASTPSPVASTLAPLAKSSMGLSNQQVQQILAYAKAKALQRQNYGG